MIIDNHCDTDFSDDDSYGSGGGGDDDSYMVIIIVVFIMHIDNINDDDCDGNVEFYSYIGDKYNYDYGVDDVMITLNVLAVIVIVVVKMMTLLLLLLLL